VKVAWTNTYATFTQRGSQPNRGFIRVGGRTISGERIDNIFYTDGLNNNLPYELEQQAQSASL
jgi:hypothetical protein